MGEAYEHDKRRIRRQIQASRSRLTLAEVCRRSVAACERVLHLPVYAAARHVVAYTSIGNEVDPSLVVEHARASGKKVYLPVDGEGDSFFRGGAAVDADDDLDVAVRHDEGDVFVLVPGIAFDPRGVRLGRGGGWYDRALARHPHGVRVGLAYALQIVPHVPEAPWDVRVHAIVTEVQLIAAAAEVDRALKESRP